MQSAINLGNTPLEAIIAAAATAAHAAPAPACSYLDWSIAGGEVAHLGHLLDRSTVHHVANSEFHQHPLLASVTIDTGHCLGHKIGARRNNLAGCWLHREPHVLGDCCLEDKISERHLKTVAEPGRDNSSAIWLLAQFKIYLETCLLVSHHCLPNDRSRCHHCWLRWRRRSTEEVEKAKVAPSSWSRSWSLRRTAAQQVQKIVVAPTSCGCHGCRRSR